MPPSLLGLPCFFKHAFLSISSVASLVQDFIMSAGQPSLPALIHPTPRPSIIFLKHRLSRDPLSLKILQSLPVSHEVQTPSCSLGSMFWAPLTFLASFPVTSLSLCCSAQPSPEKPVFPASLPLCCSSSPGASSLPSLQYGV